MKNVKTITIIIICLGLVLITGLYSYAQDSKKQASANPSYQLIGTIVKNDSGKSVAIIRDKSINKEMVLKIGEKLGEFSLVKIKRAEVQLLKQGKVYSLKLPLGGGAEFITVLSERERLVNRTALGDRYKDLNEAFRAGVVFPNIEKGRLRGLKIVRINDKEIAARAGVKEGDVVLAVNNHKLENIQQALDIYKEIRTDKKITLKVKRNGKTQSLTYYMNWEGGKDIPEVVKRSQL